MSQINSVIAIDGPAGAGKSTIAKLLAERLGYLYIDTGAMYRAITLKALRLKVPFDDAAALGRLAETSEIRLAPPELGQTSIRVWLDGEDVTALIRSTEVSGAVSYVARASNVREALVPKQRSLAANGGVVMDGRDIGSVVLPGADFKFYLVADLAERARRRTEELQAAGEQVTTADVAEEMRRRDRIDSERDVAPLRPADAALIVDSTHLNIEDVLGVLLHHIGRI